MSHSRCRTIIGRTVSHGTRDAETVRARFRDETDHDPVPLHLEVRPVVGIGSSSRRLSVATKKTRPEAPTQPMARPARGA
jgi:hypothetical protein